MLTYERRLQQQTDLRFQLKIIYLFLGTYIVHDDYDGGKEFIKSVHTKSVFSHSFFCTNSDKHTKKSNTIVLHAQQHIMHGKKAAPAEWVS